MSRPVGSVGKRVTGLGARVTMLRVRRGWSQEVLGREVARRVYPSGRWEFSKSLMCQVEKGETMPSLPVFAGLVRALDTSADYLLFGDPDG